jgi:ABC-type transport system substrate-binding protein
MLGYEKDLGKQWQHNMGKAKEALKQAGYADGRGLPPITFFHTASQAPLGKVLQAQVEANLGVRITLEEVDSATSRARLLSGDYQIVSSGRVAEYPEADSFLAEGFGCQRYEGGKCTQYTSSNRALYANPEFDTVMQQATKEIDQGRRVKLYVRAQKTLVGDAPAIFLGYAVRNFLVKPYVRDLVRSPLHREIPGDLFLERTYIATK